YTQQVNVGLVTSYTLKGLAANTTYYLVVRAYDARGTLSAPSSEVSGSPSGSQPPVVSLTSPTEGASFLTTDTVSVQATASGDELIQSVAFLLNGSPWGAPDTSFPYGTTISGLAAGTYTLTAVVTDALLVTATSAAVHFTVANTALPGSRTNVALSSNG